MKKAIALLLTLALVISAAALPALAEDSAGTVNQIASATQQVGQNNQFGRGGHGGRQQMPGQNSQNGQMPQMPGQDNQNSQTPQMPGKGGKGNRQGRFAVGQNGRTVKNGKLAIFDRLLAEGVITQEVYDAIIAWLQQQMPQALQNAEAPAESTAPAEGTEPPALPGGTAPADSTNEQEALLKSLLESGVITQEQYDLLASALQTPPAPPAAPAAGSDT